MTSTTNQALWKHSHEVSIAADILLYLAGVGSDRLSLTQTSFFLLAAKADVSGKPKTRTTIIDDDMDGSRGSIRNSYRQLMQASRLYPNALSWLITEDNPMDEREKLLRLTDEGKKVVQEIAGILEKA